MCTPADCLPSTSTQIIPVCSGPPDEIELEPARGPDELVVIADWVDARPQIAFVSHPLAFPSEPLPADVAALAVSAPEGELVSSEVPPLARIIEALLPGRRAIEKVMCPLRSTKLCFFLRPANHGSARGVKRKACEKVWYECGTHDHAREMKKKFEGWRVAENPLQAIRDEEEFGGNRFRGDRCFRAFGGASGIF